MSHLPIRWRLTVWYALLLAATFLLFGLGLYVGFGTLLRETFEEQLRSQSALALSAIRTDGGQLALDPSTVASLRNDEHFVRLIDLDGTVLEDTGATLGGVPIDEAAVSGAMTGTTGLSIRHVPGGPVGIATMPIRSGETVVGVLQVGQVREVEEVLQLLLIAFAIAAPVMLVVATLGGYLLAGRALAPIQTITNLAAGIEGDDLHARLNLDLPDDELGRLARTFDSMLTRIDDAFERQRRFTGDAAHELRTPLSVMRSQVDLSLAEPRSAMEYRGALQEIEGDLDRMTSLVGTLLALARSDSGQLQLERSAFDLAEMVALVIEQYGAVAAESNIGLADDSTSTPVSADQDLIIQVLVNLLDNAFAHTPAGGAISVGCRSEGDGVLLTVTDTGGGIAAEHRDRVFDRFYRVDAGRARGAGGIGLGLSICRAIIDAHGGTIMLTSDIGQGTRVEVRLP